MRYFLHLREWLKQQRRTTAKVGKRVKQQQLAWIASGAAASTATLESPLWFPIRPIYVTPCPTNSAPGYSPKRSEDKHPQKTCIRMFTAAPVTVIPNWEQPKWPSAEKEINCGSFLRWHRKQTGQRATLRDSTKPSYRHYAGWRRRLWKKTYVQLLSREVLEQEKWISILTEIRFKKSDLKIRLPRRRKTHF